MKDQDSIFFKNFSIMLGVLVLLTIILAIMGYMKHDELLGDKGDSRDRSAIANTIKTVASVNTGDIIVAVEEDNAEPAVAFEGSTDAEMIYQNVCFACHGTGAANAPKLEAAAWTDRMAVGMDALVASAIVGKGAMPPKGGRADLSDEQMKVTVEFMTAGF